MKTTILQSEIENRLAKNESLRSIAKSLGVTYQTLQYHRRRWGGKPLKKSTTKGENHASWRGGEFIDQWGYRMIRAPHRGKCNPYVPEHILVVEKVLGRLLCRGEVVHHINGKKLDNRQENLLVCTRAQHKKLHAQLESIAFDLLRENKIKFRDGQYHLPD